MDCIMFSKVQKSPKSVAYFLFDSKLGLPNIGFTLRRFLTFLDFRPP